jgi:hypothetical protein
MSQPPKTNNNKLSTHSSSCSDHNATVGQRTDACWSETVGGIAQAQLQQVFACEPLIEEMLFATEHCRQLMHLTVAIVAPAQKPASDESSTSMILQANHKSALHNAVL